MTKAHHGRKRRAVVTHAGEIAVSRVYFRCVKCGIGGYPLDDRLGIDGRYSPTARRLICLAAASWSFDVSSERLEDFCGLAISDTTIRDVAQKHGADMLKWQREEFDAIEAFREAEGDVEFTTDGTCVNTTDGWREAKVAIFSKREPGDAAEPADWDSRTLPKPKGCIAFAAIEKSRRFGRRWKAWKKRLGLTDASMVTVLGDGAKWIWEEQRKHLSQAEGVLDIFHAWQHVAATAKVMHPDSDKADAWTDEGRTALLERGAEGIDALIESTLADVTTDAARRSLESLRDYLAPHEDHLNYRDRLSAGRSIGSGQIEGACKNLIGRRLKQTSARWRIQRANRMAGLCSIMYSDQWTLYWRGQTA